LALGARIAVQQPLVLVPCILAAAGLCLPATRSRGVFYLCAGVLYFVLALGPSTPLFGWYLKLPMSPLFREPARLMWLTSFCLAVLTGLGVQSLLEAGAATTGRRVWLSAVAMVAVLVGFQFLVPDGLRPLEWALGVVTVASGVGAMRSPAHRRG